MSRKLRTVAFCLVVVCVALVSGLWRSARQPAQQPSVEADVSTGLVRVAAVTQVVTMVQDPNKIKRRASELSPGEREWLRANFEAKYKPAIERWREAYGGHVPFSPGAVTADRFVERIGRDPSYNEYVFVVEGITLGVVESKGSVQVGYFNVGSETARLGTIPKQPGPPSLESPVPKEEIRRMLN